MTSPPQTPGGREQGDTPLSSYGPEERALFEGAAARLYEEVVAARGLPVNDPRLDTAELRRAFDLLVAMGLLVFHGERECWLPVDPGNVGPQIIAPLNRQSSELLEESTRWSRAFIDLNHTWRRSPVTTSHEALTHLTGDAIQPFVANAVAGCDEEMLTAQPQTGRDQQTLLEAALRDTSALDRGIKMRTLYQHSARRSSITHTYVAAITARGAEVRTLDEFFNRMIVIDRRLALIPGSEDFRVLIAVRDPGVVFYLADIFDRTWQRARPFTNRDRRLLKDIAAEQRAMTIRMLVEGDADPVGAKRLGVSPRTYAGYVADLKVEFEAATRFQLGFEMGRRGISGHEATDEQDD